MAHRRPDRKKRIRPFKPERFHPLDRSVRHRIIKRAVERQKKKSGYQEWKAMRYVIAGMILAMALIVILYNLTRSHEE